MTQPPPHECQFCGADLDKGTHRLTCKVVVGPLPDDWLEIPDFLDRRNKTGRKPAIGRNECPDLSGDGAEKSL